MSDRPSFTCPKCGRTSYHPDDIAEGYCGACNDWTGTAVNRPDPESFVDGGGQMSDLIRPGPPAIDPDEEPGGIVIHVYAVPTERLLHVSHAATEEEAAYRAGRDADATFAALDPELGETAVCLVTYDGDTGERIIHPDYRPGQVL